MFVDFLYELRRSKVPVGRTEAVALARALARRAARSSLDGFYYVARSILVHRESHLDAFDVAFARALPRRRGRCASASAEELLEWLKRRASAPELTDEERALLEALDLEELRASFEETPARADRAPRRRQPLDRDRRHLSFRARRLSPFRHCASGGSLGRQERDQDRRRARLPGLPQRPGARRAPDRGGAAQAARLRARGAPAASSTSRRPSTPPRRMPASSRS